MALLVSQNLTYHYIISAQTTNCQTNMKHNFKIFVYCGYDGVSHIQNPTLYPSLWIITVTYEKSEEIVRQSNRIKQQNNH